MQTTGVAAFVLLAGCGGGGGVNPTPAPPPAPAPAPSPTPTPAPPPAPSPTPAPTPPPGTNNTAEYRATAGAVSMHALTAYDNGATGQGITVGVIDSGIDLQSEEFGDCSGGVGTATCRISAASRDTAGNASIDDVGGHGTAVAFTIAGRRNGAGTHGVAFDSVVMVVRADEPGSCATEDPADKDSGCSFNDSDIAQGIDAARVAGARVINISLGGDPPSADVLKALGRATTAGVIVVMSAGNDGKANPGAFTQGATDPAVGHGLIIIAGSVKGSGPNPDAISSFSNRAGTGRNVYLAAVGDDVRAPGADNTPFLWSGTSFSAPQISGAIALLAQAFPNLSGEDIVALLYATARDAGDPGVDAVYGRGVLDLERAFEPVGTMTVAGTTATVSQSVNASLSTPMGDARQTSALRTVALDAFDRAYGMDLTYSIDRQGPGRRLQSLMAARNRGFSVGVNGMNFAVSLTPERGGLSVDPLSLSSGDAARAKALAASVTGRLGSKAQFAIGASESGTSLTARLAGRAEPAFLIARDPATEAGFDVDTGSAVAVRRSFGTWGLTIAGESGAVLSPRDTQFEALRRRYERSGYGRVTIAVDRAIGGLRMGLGASRLTEADTVLGARFSGALGAARAQSWFADLNARWDISGGWTLGGSARQGWTQAHLRGGVEGEGAIRTNGFAIDFGKAGVFGRDDRFGLRVAQPLRVSHGAIDLSVPAGWDYASESVDAWDAARINLAPQGREVDYELRYSAPFWLGDFSGNVFARKDPGNFATLSTDYGAAVRFSFDF